MLLTIGYFPIEDHIETAEKPFEKDSSLINFVDRQVDEVEEILECSPLECLPLGCARLGRLLGLRASLGSANGSMLLTVLSLSKEAEHSKTIHKTKAVKILRLDTP